MLSPLKTFFNFLNHYSRKDRNGIIVLTSIVLVLIVANVLVQKIEFNTTTENKEVEKIFQQWEISLEADNKNKHLFDFNPNLISSEKLDSLLIPEKVKTNLLKYRAAGGRFNSKEDIQKIYGMNDSIFNVVERYVVIPEIKREAETRVKESTQITQEKNQFDLNRTGYDTLLNAGLSSFQANNIIKYRKSGGRFYKKEDLLKIYGVDTLTFEKVKHLAIVNPKDKEISEKNKRANEISIELNLAKKPDLMQLQGIGEVYAKRVIKYRELLGGFYCKEQIKEVYNLPPQTYENIKGQLKVDPTQIQKIRINFADYGQLVKHPYISSGCANAILAFRTQNGSFFNKDQLRSVNGIDSVTYNKISSYLTCR